MNSLGVSLAIIICLQLQTTINSAPTLPTFTSKETNFTVEVGALNVRLLCRLDVSSKTKYWWTRNGVIIKKSRKYRSKKFRYLRVRNVNVLDEGDYVCWARNEAGTVQRTITLIVVDRECSHVIQDVKPYFTEKRKTIKDYLLYPAGHKVQLVCSAAGIPAPTVVWYKDGKELKYIPDELTPLTPYNFVITLESLKPKDTGRYNCNVSNRAGSIDMTYEVIVKEMMITRPILESHTENITAYEGDNVTITCKAVSYGLPHFQWVVVNPKKNNSIDVLKPGHSQEEYVLDADNTRWHGVKLLLRNVTSEDGRDYFCVVGDNRGYDKQKFRLRVLPKPVPTTQKPVKATEIKNRNNKANDSEGNAQNSTQKHRESSRFTQALRPRGLLEFPKSYHVEVGKIVQMKCDMLNRGKNDYITLEWFKDGKLIRSIRRFATEWITRNSLTISDAKKDDAGWYKCRIANAFGSVSWEFKLSVGET